MGRARRTRPVVAALGTTGALRRPVLAPPAVHRPVVPAAGGRGRRRISRLRRCSSPRCCWRAAPPRGGGSERASAAGDGAEGRGGGLARRVGPVRWFVRPRLEARGWVGRLFRHLAGTRRCRDSRNCSPAPSRGTCSCSSTCSGRSGCSPRWRGTAVLLVSRRAALGDGVAGGLRRRAGGVHAQCLPRPLPDVGEPAVRPGGPAAREHRRSRAPRALASRARRGSPAGPRGPVPRSSRRSSRSTPATPARWPAGGSGRA